MAIHVDKASRVQAVKFFFFSISAGLIEAGSFALLYGPFKLPYWPAYLIALVLSVLWNFTLNRRYTFRSTANVPVAMLKVLGFYAVFTPVSTIAGDWCEGHGVNGFIVLLVTMVCNLVLEFLFCKFVVYRDSIDTRPDVKKEKA